MPSVLCHDVFQSLFTCQVCILLIRIYPNLAWESVLFRTTRHAAVCFLFSRNCVESHLLYSGSTAKLNADIQAQSHRCTCGAFEVSSACCLPIRLIKSFTMTAFASILDFANLVIVTVVQRYTTILRRSSAEVRFSSRMTFRKKRILCLKLIQRVCRHSYTRVEGRRKMLKSSCDKNARHAAQSGGGRRACFMADLSYDY